MKRQVKLRSLNHGLQHRTAYRPSLEVLEDRLPPGEAGVGSLAAGSLVDAGASHRAVSVASETRLVAPESRLLASTAPFLAREGRQSVARGVSPWNETNQSAVQPRRGDSATNMSASLSPFQGSDGQRVSVSQGLRPGLMTCAPSELDGWLDEEAWDSTGRRSTRPTHAYEPPLERASSQAFTTEALGSTAGTLLQAIGTTAMPAPALMTKQQDAPSLLFLALAADAQALPAMPESQVHALSHHHSPSNLAPAGKEGISFTRGGAYTVGQTPGQVVSGDFNGDNIPDLAVVDQETDAVSILFGQGDGTFIAGNVLGVGRSPWGIATGDLNGDGALDLVVSNSVSGTLSIWLGDPDFPSHFLPAPTMQVGGALRQVVVGDFNGDHIPDIAVASSALNQIAVLQGNGDGTFQTPQYFGAGGTGTTDLAIADFNGDGVPDLVATNNSSGTIAVFLGKGDGSFREPQTFALGVDPGRLTVGDFNGDGVPDLAVTHAPQNSTNLDILVGRGDGTFDRTQRLPILGLGVTAVTTADFDGDKVLDLAVADVGGVAILRGRGDGTFDEARYFEGAGQLGLVAADFNGDGLPDLAVTRNEALQGTTFQVVILANTTPQPDNQLQPIYPVAIDRDIIYYDGPGFLPTRHILDVYRPVGETNFPVLVFNFGNFGGSAKDTWGFLGQVFAGQGIGVVIANRRVSPTEAPYAEQMVDPARSLAWTFDHIAEYGGDPKAVFLSGHSVGGWLAGLLSLDGRYLEAQGHSPDELRGVLPMSGTYDLLSSGPGWRGLVASLSEEEQLALSPITRIGEHTMPFLVTYGGDELPGIRSQGARFYDALAEAGYDVGLVDVPGATHNTLPGSLILPEDPARIAMLRFIAEHS